MTHFHKLFTTMAFAASLLAGTTFQAKTLKADDQAGVVRISDQNSPIRSGTVIRANDDLLLGDIRTAPASEDASPPATDVPNATAHDSSSTEEIYYDSNCGRRHGLLAQWWDDQLSLYYARRLNNEEGIEYARYRRYCWWANQNARYRSRNEFLNRQLKDHIECKFGYFIPTGCCGRGCPIAGRYRMVYAVDPNYFDPRDGQIFSAQGSGVPMAVPLAPNVGHTYNYSWGLPSSRLTPISNVTSIPAH